MQVIRSVVPTDGVHIGIDALAGRVAEKAELHPLPFGERLHDLDLLPRGADRKGDLALRTVQVVIDPPPRLHDDGRGDAVKAQRGGEPHLKQVLDVLDGALRLTDGERGRVGDDGMVR